jgi:ATP-binding cassette, subfamily B, multidrug efflux pump
MKHLLGDAFRGSEASIGWIPNPSAGFAERSTKNPEGSPQGFVCLGWQEVKTKAAVGLATYMLTRLLRTFLRKYAAVLGSVIGLQLVQTVAALYLPRLLANIIDNGVAKGNNRYVWTTGSIMLVITLVQVVFAIGAVYFGSRAAMGFGRDVRGALFRQVGAFSAREVGELGAPSLITRITNDVQQVQMLVLMTCTLLVAAPITAVGGIIMALRVDAGLSSILLVSIPALAVGVGLVIARMVPQFRLMQERIDAVNRVLREQITGMRVVRAFVREPHETKRFARVNDDVTETSLRAGRLMAFFFPIVTMVLNVSSAAVLWFGAGRVNDGTLSVGSMIAFLSYLSQILISVMQATFMAVMIPRAAVCAERIQEVLDTVPSVATANNPVRELVGRASLELRNAGFQYPGAQTAVLEGISVHCRAGETTAIIGSTGSGKTTLVGLIPRLFDVTDGAVLMNGVDVRDIDPDVLRARIGLVPQKPYLFSGTVASNLRYGKTDATNDELWEALTVAQAADFVRSMPDQLESAILQGGSNVSGGQRQRLAIARALIRRPDIYLFDDSFSALDLVTDANLRAALKPYTVDAAVVIVAQRISTIRTADQIMVLEDGQIVGLGKHAELLDNCPTYVEIAASQATEAAAA